MTGEASFIPEYDLDGNQTRIRTSTGIWTASYNAQNRPILFTRENADGTRTVITAAYDYLGRRAWKKVETIATDAETGEETATVTLHQRYIYRGYLQVAACDLTRGGHPCLWLITWDPTQPIATRPLAIQKDGTWYCYGWDLTKNICEVFGQAGYIRTTYAYTPYGSVTEEGDVAQPLQWSSEYADSELGLVYYNYRYYNPTDGRWIRRDLIGMMGGANVYVYLRNFISCCFDYLGLSVKGHKFDGYHAKRGSCESTLDCIENYERLKEWVIVAFNRRESDFTAEWLIKSNPRDWNAHRSELLKAMKEAASCFVILEEKLRKGECCPRLPQYDSLGYWKEKYDGIDDPGEYPETLQRKNESSPWELALEFALVALIAGQAGPQVSVPEELITVPGAFLTGFLIAL